MPSEPTPYNITLSDQSSILQYLPLRDDSPNSSWYVSYSGISETEWNSNYVWPEGTSSHSTTLIGASVQLDWTCTAVYLYGQANAGAYAVQIDEMPVVTGGGSLRPGGVLFSQVGLQYGSHSVILRVIQGGVTITGAIATVGMGASGTIVETRNISAMIDNSIENPFFSFDSSMWFSMVPYGLNESTTRPYPRICSHDPGAVVSFNLNSTTAFAIYGGLDNDQGTYNVSVIPPPPFGPSQSTQFNASSHWMTLDQVKYLATGMDRTETYQVIITNESNNFVLADVVAYDALPVSSSATMGIETSVTTTRSPTNTSDLRHSTSVLSAGAIYGITFGSVSAISVVLVVYYAMYRRRRRRGHFNPGSFVTDGINPNEAGQTRNTNLLESLAMVSPYTKMYGTEQQPSNEHARASNSRQVVHEQDAGPVIQPPEYDPAWYSETPRAGQEQSPSLQVITERFTTLTRNAPGRKRH
ncbi:hypothetical protein AcW1_009780 [Taiwanofungus camphoratus]|nr:hypothetical protein AcW1_009780 [Antrodia cinnamomea]